MRVSLSAPARVKQPPPVLPRAVPVSTHKLRSWSRFPAFIARPVLKAAAKHKHCLAPTNSGGSPVPNIPLSSRREGPLRRLLVLLHVTSRCGTTPRFLPGCLPALRCPAVLDDSFCCACHRPAEGEGWECRWVQGWETHPRQQDTPRTFSTCNPLLLRASQLFVPGGQRQRPLYCVGIKYTFKSPRFMIRLSFVS